MTVRPGASWAGWAGYAPTARGPEVRRARAEAAGLLDPSPTETPAVVHPCAARQRGHRRLADAGASNAGLGEVVRFDPARRPRGAPSATPPQRRRVTLM